MAPARRRAGDWAILLTLSLGFFMTLLDLTIVNIAIPDMRRDLHASLAEIGWVINAYVIVLAVLMITAGRLGDLRGRRNLFVVGIAVFTLASAAAGLSRSGTELIAARVVQGFGAALLMPQTMAIIIAIFPRDRRGAALGVWGGVAALATIAGPTVGGVLVTWRGWRWIFFVNVPLGIVAMILAAAIIPDVRTGRRLPLDLPGVLIASAGLVAITYGLVEGQSSHWGPVWSFVSIPLIFVAGVALLVIFVLVQALRQARRPLLPFTLFQDRNYTLMAAVSVIISIGLVGMALPLTLYLQTALGFSAIKAGLTMAPASLASGFSAPFVGKLADKGGKYLLITGFTLYATGLISICLVAGPASHWYDLVPGYVITGLGVGFTMSPMQTIATRNVDPALAGAASGVLNTTRQTGSALGSAVVLAILQNRLAAHVSYVTAMRSALAFPIVMLLLAAVACTAIRERPLPAPAVRTPPVPLASSAPSDAPDPPAPALRLTPAPAAPSAATAPPAPAPRLTPAPRAPFKKTEPESVLAAPTAAPPVRHPESPAAAFLPAHRRLEATPMTDPDDRWLRWLVDTRSGDHGHREHLLNTFLYPLRDELLNRAQIQPGEIVLDVGTGAGLIGYGALDRVGPTGRVIFSDVSPDLVGHCQAAVTAEGLLDRSAFLVAAADDLSRLPEASVNVVTARSVLIYVADKAAAFREFHRVLRPGGRAVLAEPITPVPADGGFYLGYDLSPIRPIAVKVSAYYTRVAANGGDPLLSFDDWDLLDLAEAAGFGEIHLELRVDVQAPRPPCPWDRFLRTAPNPRLPSFGQVLGEALDRAEADELTGYLRPLVESGRGRRRQALAGLAAVRN
ncbi:MAG TPA: DHA2 family efflux MFS transporter permease subunit [Streptosporangiaceae bacterium]|nr:DHA2 family efflux MFS transporter permease subunit [Streptosporangiaceae bacterium]